MTATQATIFYVPKMNMNWTCKNKQYVVSHCELKKRQPKDFKKGFNEVLINMDYVRLYFDFDHVDNMDKSKELKVFLDGLTAEFGPYAVGGYAKDKELAEFWNVKLIEDYKEIDKIFSCHVVYYQSKVDAKLLTEIMDVKNEKYKVEEFIDRNVYKLTSGQLLRHPFSDKIGTEKKRTAGSSSDTADKLVATCDGNETYEGDLLKLFPLNEDIEEKPIKKQKFTHREDPLLKKLLLETGNYVDEYEEEEEEQEEEQERKPVKQTRNRPKVKTAKVEDLIVNNDLILFNDEEMDEFLSHFQPEFINLGTTLAPLRYSPYSYDFLKTHLTKWYGQRKHTQGIDNVVEQQMNYYKQENNNKWFFSLIKHLPVQFAKEYREKYCGRIDETININNSNWTLEDITDEEYDIRGAARLINDLRGVIGFNKDRWYVKTTKDNQYYIQEATDEKVTKMLKHYKPFKDNTKISLAQIVMHNSNYFKYKGAEFSKDNKEGFINLFQGFKYEESTSDDFTPLADFLNHIKEVICSNDEAKYDYFMKWWANVIQNITVKNGTMPIIHGAQGSGKSFPVECFCELFGNYALMNVDDMDKVFGKFNGLLGRQLIIVINEPPEANEKFKYAGKIKSKLTQKKTVQELKGVDQIEVDSWANFILTTNNANPVQEEKGNRRFIYYATDDKYCGKEEYQKRVFAPIQPKKQGEYNKEFMSLLLHYMKTQIDVSDFDAEKLIREINNNTQTDSNEQLERQYLSLSNVDRFIVDNSDKFINGIKLSDIKVDGYKEAGLGKALINTCTNKRVRVKETVDGETKTIFTRVYTLKPRNEIPDLYAIIDYKKYQDEHAEVIDETI